MGSFSALENIFPIYLWERLLLSFKAVDPTARFLCPSFIRSITSYVEETGTRLASGTLRPFWELFLISNVSKTLRNTKLKHKNEHTHLNQKIKKLKKRISLVASINNQKVSDLLVVNFNHLNSNIITECVFSLFSKKKQITKCSVVNSLTLLRYISWSTLEELYKGEKHIRSLTFIQKCHNLPTIILPLWMFFLIQFDHMQICRHCIHQEQNGPMAAYQRIPPLQKNKKEPSESTQSLEIKREAF